MSSSSAQWRCIDSYGEDPFTLLSFINKEWVLVPGKKREARIMYSKLSAAD
jgi:hypothetical protein